MSRYAFLFFLPALLLGICAAPVLADKRVAPFTASLVQASPDARRRDTTDADTCPRRCRAGDHQVPWLDKFAAIRHILLRLAPRKHDTFRLLSDPTVPFSKNRGLRKMSGG